MTDSLAPLRAAIRRRGHERDSQRSGPTRTPTDATATNSANAPARFEPT